MGVYVYAYADPCLQTSAGHFRLRDYWLVNQACLHANGWQSGDNGPSSRRGGVGDMRVALKPPVLCFAPWSACFSFSLSYWFVFGVLLRVCAKTYRTLQTQISLEFIRENNATGLCDEFIISHRNCFISSMFSYEN